jgi:plasmid stabilization system protein ParE
MAARILTAARERLLEIWDYTEAKWGEEQADSYVRKLVEAVEHMQSQRHRWRAVGDAALRGVFFFRHEHHYVFFRELEGGTVGVISILHEKMDIPSRLREDAGRQEE